MNIDTDRHIRQLKNEGYTVVPQAITSDELDPIRIKWDEHMAVSLKETPDAIHAEIKRCLEQDPVFEPLMNLPTTFPIAHAIFGNDITLATAGEGDYRAPNTPAYIGWHNDFAWMQDVPYPRQNFWLRCTYFIDDVTDDMGPFTLLPGSHKADHGPTRDLTGEDGQPIVPPEAVRVTGKAGDCLINNTEIWHTNTPNRSDRPRKMLMVLYKHAWMRQWQDGYGVTEDFAQRQTDPVRRQLCGIVNWHRRFERVGEE
jgi:hypothetical protein